MGLTKVKVLAKTKQFLVGEDSQSAIHRSTLRISPCCAYVDKEIHTIKSCIWIWYTKQFYVDYKLIYPSHVPMGRIEATNGCHLFWHSYCMHPVCSFHAQFLYLYRHLIRWNIKFIMLISKYILLDRGYEFDTQNNFMWITNCKTWRDYCLIICLLSTFLFLYTFWYVFLVIPEM